MKASALLLTALASCIACAKLGPPQYVLAEPPSIEELQEETVVVVSRSPRGATLCAGAVVAHVLVTAAHCVAGGKAEIALHDETTMVAHEIHRDRHADLSVLLPERDPGNGLELAPRRALGQQVWLMGHPGRILWTLSTGSMSNTDRQFSPGPERFWQVSAQSWRGGSGGPCVDRRGRLLGLASSVIPDTPVTFLVPATEIRRVLRRLSVLP